MTQGIRVFSGKVVARGTAEERKQGASVVATAQDEAARIVAQAEAQADAIIAKATQIAAEKEARVQNISDQELAKFVDITAVDQAAYAVQSVIRAGHNLRADFDAFTPWMQDFIKDAVVRIIGELPAENVWKGVLCQSVMDIRDRWNLVLRCSPSRVDLIRAVVADTPTLSAAFQDIRADRGLSADDCLIESAQGIVDVSVSTQIVTLILALEKVADDATLGQT